MVCGKTGLTREKLAGTGKGTNPVGAGRLSDSATRLCQRAKGESPKPLFHQKRTGGRTSGAVNPFIVVLLWGLDQNLRVLVFFCLMCCISDKRQCNPCKVHYINSTATNKGSTMHFNESNKSYTAWLMHSRELDAPETYGKQGWVLTYSVFFSMESKLNHVGQAFGVMDDFGFWQEVER